jgi:hypothetical protein
LAGERSVELLAHGHGSAERVAGGVGLIGRDARRDLLRDLVSVDGGPEGAEDRDAQGAAQLPAGLRDRGRRPCALRRGGGEDQVVREGEERREAK